MDDEELRIEEINTKELIQLKLRWNQHDSNMHHLEIQSDLIYPTWLD
jgi:hypothetical protein